MKQITFIFIGMFFSNLCFSQNDSIEKPNIWIRPYFENGIAFLNNDYLKEAYATNSTYNWGAGFRIGNPQNKLLIYLQYSNSTYTVQSINMIEEFVDSTLKIQEFMFGFNILLKKINSNLFRAKVGYIHSLIDDDIFNNSDRANGLQIGLGYEARIFKNSRVYIDYSYDFIKLKKASFRDYDIQKITLGFIL